MRKVTNILMMVSMIIALAVGASYAATVVGTAHDVASLTSSQGTCAVCHIPHKSPGGDRLWATPMGAVDGNGVVGRLCFACHGTGGTYVSGILDQAGYAANYVLPAPAGGAASTATHQLEINGYVQNGAGTDELAGIVTNLPYTEIDEEDTLHNGGANFIQCTSCHNVHDNSTARPFLRVNIRDLCVQCHAHRHGTRNNNAPGAALVNWLPADQGATNWGTHPVGPNVTDDMGIDGANPVIAFTAAGGYMRVFENLAGLTDRSTTPGDAFPDASGVWNLGRHTANNTNSGTGGLGAAVNGIPGDGVGDGVVCVSCHAIHGNQNDASASALVPQAFVNLLAVSQGTISDLTPAAMNGLNQDANFLCESCHHEDNAGVPFGTAVLWATAGNFTMNDGNAYPGTNYPNPGGTPFTHPIDDAIVGTLVGTGASLVTAFPAGWPEGSAAAVGAGDPRPICESCHVPHGYRNSAETAGVTKARGDVDLGSATSTKDPLNVGGFLLRDAQDEVCNDCHANTNSACWSDNGADDDGANGWRHHPVGDVGVALVGTVGNQDATLTCDDCHNGTGAHNWGAAAAIGLDPTWLPAQNGRVGSFTNPVSAGGDTIGGVTPQASYECERCHAIFGGGLGNSPTLGHGASAPEVAGLGAEWCSEPEFQKTGSGTHLLGDVSAGLIWAAGNAGGGLMNAATGVWPNGGWSRWDSLNSAGGAATAGQHLVCESCHELEPDKNRPNSKLLLHKFNEDTTFGAGVSQFCEGCHSHNPGMTNSHPMKGDITSKTKVAFTAAQRPCNDVTEKIPLDLAEPRANLGYTTYSAGSVGPGAPAYPPAGNGRNADATYGGCDMCHQVHDAATFSATYILDAPEANVTDGATAGNTTVKGGAVAVGHNAHPDGNSDLNFTNYCEQCHCYAKP